MLYKAVCSPEGRLRSRWHIAETSDEAREKLNVSFQILYDKIIKFSRELPSSLDETSWAQSALQSAITVLKTVSSEVAASTIARIAEAARHLRVARDRLAVGTSTAR